MCIKAVFRDGFFFEESYEENLYNRSKLRNRRSLSETICRKKSNQIIAIARNEKKLHELAEEFPEIVIPLCIDSLKPEDIAESVYCVSELPPHININMLEIMPQAQSFSMFTFDRTARTD